MSYIRGLLTKLGIADSVSHVLVNSAYSNSRCGKYLEQQGVKNVLVKTGVKHAEPVVEEYVIGANDEPNGHGTVAYNKVELEAALTGDYSYEARKLRALLEISNTVVGDALANILVLEAIMYDLD